MCVYTYTYMYTHTSKHVNEKNRVEAIMFLNLKLKNITK